VIYIYTPYRLHIEDVVIYIYTPYRLHIEVVVIYIYTPYRLHIEAVVIYIYTPYRLHIEAVLIYIYTPYRLHIEAVVIYSSWYNCAFVGHSKKGSVTLLFVGVKRLGHEINGLPPSGEEVQNDRSFTSTCPPPSTCFRDVNFTTLVHLFCSLQTSFQSIVGYHSGRNVHLQK